MELNFFDEVKSGMSSRGFLKVLDKVLGEDSVLSVSLVSEDKIKELNKKYRGKDYVTDVLSFESDGKEELGDIFICFERAAKQANEKSINLEEEILFLFCHGVLHLLGYNHKEGDDWQKEEGEMRGKEMWEKMQKCLM